MSLAENRSMTWTNYATSNAYERACIYAGERAGRRIIEACARFSPFSLSLSLVCARLEFALSLPERRERERKREREREREIASRSRLTFMDKGGLLYFPRLSTLPTLAFTKTCACTQANKQTSTHARTHARTPTLSIYREGSLEIHGRFSTCRFLRVSRCVCAPPGPLVLDIFFLGIAFRRASAANYVRMKRPWSHAAIGRARRKPRSAIGPRRFFVAAEPSRAEPISRTRTFRPFARSPGTLLCIVDLDGALTAVPFPWLCLPSY